MKRSKWISWIGLAATALALVSGVAQAQPKELTFWTFLATQGTDPRSKALSGIVEGFN